MTNLEKKMLEAAGVNPIQLSRVTPVQHDDDGYSKRIE